MSRREVTTDAVNKKYGLVVVGWDSPLRKADLLTEEKSDMPLIKKLLRIDLIILM